MILAALLFAGLIGESDPALVARLKSCGMPASETQAIRCLNHSLSPSERRAISQKSQPTFTYWEGAAAWTDDHSNIEASIEQGLSLDDEGSPLVRAYENQGYPLHSATARPVELLLESYWLHSKGCEYDARARVKAKLLDVAEIERASRSEVQDDAPAPHSLEVDCANWSAPVSLSPRPLP